MPFRVDMEAADYLDILLRRKWYILFSFFTILFGAGVYCVITPEIFKSSTTILVVAQRVPEGYVRSTITTPVNERLFTIRQQVLGRTRLVAVMDELGLYKEERKKSSLEDLVEKMRKDTTIQIISSTAGAGHGRGTNTSGDAFTLTFTYENPLLAMLTTSRLASFFIDENIRSREQQAVGTSEFLESQLKETKARLESQEEKVKEYKLRFMGELPQQLQSNLQILSRLQEQLRSNSEAIRQANDRKVYLEAQVGLFRAQLGAVPSQASAMAGSGLEAPVPSILPNTTLENELSLKRSQLMTLSSKYTEQYPQIRRLKEEVAQLEKRLASGDSTRSLGENTVGTPRPLAASGGAAYSQASGTRERDEVLRLQAQSTAIDSEIASLQKDRQGIEKSMAVLEERIEKSPRREQEMVSLMRDYDNLKISYNELLKKKLDAEVSQNLEERQKGEQFQVLDPANLPESPFAPDRKKVFAIAFAVACLVSIGGAFGFEIADPTLRGKREFQSFFQIPVLASIPIIRDTAYESRKRIRKTVIYSGLVSFAALVTVFLVVYGQKVRLLLMGTFG